MCESELLRGQVGWTDSRNLLSTKQMEALAELAEEFGEAASPGRGYRLRALNMHAEPFRTSTSFYQIAEGVRVDVLTHTSSPKVAIGSARPANSLDLNKPAPRHVRKERKNPSIRLLLDPRRPAYLRIGWNCQRRSFRHHRREPP